MIVTAVLYALVFFTKGSNTPKLGIDLQGGTQITLTAATLDGKSPSASSMQQAQQIMTRRVNGSGVAGAQVQVDGSNHLVVTVPGNNDLPGLTASARMNVRAHLAQGYDYDFVKAASATPAPSATPSVSGAPSSDVTAPAIGDTSSAAAPTAAPSAPAASTAGSAQRLRAQAPATTAPAGSVPAASAPAAASSATTAAQAPATTAPASSAATAAASGSASASAAATGSSAAATGSSAAVPTKGAWPIAGSDKLNPNQPAAKTAAAWAAWVTAAETAVNNGSVSCTDIKKTQGEDDPARPLLACGVSTDANLQNQVFVLDQTLVPGDQISGATAGLSQSGTSGWVINVTFDSAGFKTWSNYTANNVGKQTAFVLDGVVISDPSISQAINTVTTLITGTFTQASATSLANSLNFGALPLNFTQSNATSISAELGFQYLQAGLIAGGIGLLLVVLYCLLYYRLLGLITIGSLVLSGGLVYAVMVLLGRWIDLSLDLAGIAGLIVAIGITADSFVIYFERLKDEVREGRTFRSAVPRGWERAKRTILSADAVSFLSAVVLYLVAVGDVKGFAFTLGLSTVLDLVVVYLVTHPLVALASGSRIFNSARFSGLGAVAAAGARQRAATARLTAKEA